MTIWTSHTVFIIYYFATDAGSPCESVTAIHRCSK